MLHTLRTAPLHRGGRQAVGVQPLAACLLPLVPLLALWAVLKLGRAVCLVAQRVPPVVWSVRAIRSRLSLRRAARERSGAR